MALHWDEIVDAVRALVARPPTGDTPPERLLIWANQGIKKISIATLSCKGRIVVRYNAGTVSLAEEDWPGAETIGEPRYTYGLSGAVWIKYALDIDAIREVKNTANDEEPAVWNYMGAQLLLKSQEKIGYQAIGSTPTHYGVYEFWVHTQRVPPDPPRLAVGMTPHKARAVWFDPMFLFGDADFDSYWEIQYTRIAPALDITLLNEGLPTEEYTQPWVYLPDDHDDELIEFIIRQVMVATGDPRINEINRQMVASIRSARWTKARRGSLDMPRRLKIHEGDVSRAYRLDI